MSVELNLAVTAALKPVQDVVEKQPAKLDRQQEMLDLQKEKINNLTNDFLNMQTKMTKLETDGVEP
eukprot:7107885-Prorocentrum_lima.AAC.1